MPDETPFDLHAWEQALDAVLARLGCRTHMGEEDHPDQVFLETLWDHLSALSLPIFRDDVTGELRDQYAYLQQHGYTAYWAWMAERDVVSGTPWAFCLDNAGEPEYVRLVFALECATEVLQVLDTLPDGCGAARVWAALAPLALLEEGESH